MSDDNVSKMVGIHNYVVSRLMSTYKKCFINGCPCHLVHIAASHANEDFSKTIGFDLEDLCVDLYYWFEKSSKSTFSDQEYLQVLKHISVRWPSLEKCHSRALLKHSAIQMFTSFNLLLQREDPSIHLLLAAMESLSRKLANRIVKPNAMKMLSL